MKLTNEVSVQDPYVELDGYLDPDAIPELETIRSYFAEVGFSYLSSRRELDPSGVIFPDFRHLQDYLKNCSSLYRLLFSILRQGHAADESILTKSLPEDLFQAFATCGLLRKNRYNEWSTPGVLVTCLQGLYLVVSTPPYYWTSLDPKQTVYLGVDSCLLAQSLPADLQGSRVIDVCGGSGIQGLICAARGAHQVIVLEQSERAVRTARFNVALNNLADRVTVVQSDLFSGLSGDERFDFLVSNPPSTPAPNGVAFPPSVDGGPDGTETLEAGVRGMIRFLTENARGAIYCRCLGDRSSIFFNKSVLTEVAGQAGMSFRAYVTTKLPLKEHCDIIRKLLSLHSPEFSEADCQARVEAWNAKMAEIGATHLYEQVIHFLRDPKVPGVRNFAFYDPRRTDSLYSITASQARSR